MPTARGLDVPSEQKSKQILAVLRADRLISSWRLGKNNKLPRTRGSNTLSDHDVSSLGYLREHRRRDPVVPAPGAALFHPPLYLFSVAEDFGLPGSLVRCLFIMPIGWGGGQ